MLSDHERREIMQRIARLEAQAHVHDGAVQLMPSDDRELLRRLARLEAEVKVRRGGGDS